MNDRELYLSRLDAELPAFLSVLRALPKDRLDYQPHDRSPSASQLVWQLANGHKLMCDFVETGRADSDKLPAPDLDTMIGTFEKSWKALRDRVARMDDPLRRHPPPRSAQRLRPAHGLKGSRDLRPVRRRAAEVAPAL